MKLLTNSHLWKSACVAVVLAMTGTDSQGQMVARHPDESAGFAERFEWAVDNARNADGGKAWIGFEISRRMPVGSSFAQSDRWSFHGSRSRNRGMTLYELLEGHRPPKDNRSDQESVRHAARMVLDDLGWPLPDEQYEERRVGVVIGVDMTSDTGRRWDAMWLGNIEMEFSLRGRTLLWIGSADAAESVPTLRSLLEPTTNESARERIVSTIGVQREPNVVVPVLEAVLRHDPSAEVREQAASWLGSQPSERALDILIWAARNDPHEEVREEVVSSLDCFREDRATEALIDRALHDEHREVREEAVEALGRRRSEAALEALTTIALSDAHRDVQEEAVEAIGRYPESQSLPALTTIALSHPSASVREEAVEELRMSGSAEAVVALARIAREDASADVQEEALEALLALPDEMGIEAIASIARTHTRSSMRQEAVELLASTSSVRAKQALKALGN